MLKPLTDSDVRKAVVALVKLYRRAPPTFAGGQQVAAEAGKRLSPLMRRVNPTGKVHYWLNQAVGAAERFELNPIQPPKADLCLVFEALAQARLALQREARCMAHLAEAAQFAPVVFLATVYDYNRAGVVAFQIEGVEVERWRALADGRRRVQVTVEVL